MKNKLFLRKDIKIDTNRLAKICVQAGVKIAQYDEATDIEVKEVMFLRELEVLETTFIEEGMHFQWIEEGKTSVGILAISTSELSNKPLFLEPFKDYTPDIKKDNLKAVQQEYQAKRAQEKK